MSSRSCKPYSEYDDSQRNWLGEIPSHWSAFALKFLSSERVKDGPHETPNFVDEGIPFFSVDGIQDNELVLEGCRFISEADHERYSQKCRPATGDVLLGKAASIGKVAHVQLTQPFNVWSPLAVIRPRDERMGRYIYYSIQSAYLQAQCLVQSNSNTQNNLSMRAIDNLYFPAPPVEEQTQIAQFLDYETAKIDALIEKQQQLIALLKEKRQAVISHAVTKGLNPDAPMRDSGVEWLGEVPAHWEVKQIRHVTGQLGGGTPSKDNESFWDGEIPWVSPKDMKVDYISDSQDRVTEVAVVHSSTKLIPVCSVLIVVRGMILDHSVPTALTTAPVTINQDMKALVPCRDLDGEFLLFVLKGLRDYLLSHTDSSAHGTKCLATDKLERTSIALPDLSEQRSLVRGLKERVARIDSLTESADHVSTLLQERRTALISAAVTGKIDVRGWKPPESKPQTEAA